MSLRSDDYSTVPFLKLPIEIRNIIYGYLLSHLQLPCLNNDKFKRCCRFQIPTSILYVNHQIYAESSRVLYRTNVAKIRVSRRSTTVGEVLRADHGSVKMTGLRSGLAFTTSKYSGRIYPHVLLRFEEIKIFLSRCQLMSEITPVGLLKNLVQEILGSAICTGYKSCPTASRKKLTLELGDI